MNTIQGIALALLLFLIIGGVAVGIWMWKNKSTTGGPTAGPPSPGDDSAAKKECDCPVCPSQEKCPVCQTDLSVQNDPDAYKPAYPYVTSGRKFSPGTLLQNGKIAWILQGDGNVVIYNDKQVLDATSLPPGVTSGEFTPDGNIVFYSKSIQQIIPTGGVKPFSLGLTSEGKLEVTDKTGKVMWTGTLAQMTKNCKLC